MKKSNLRQRTIRKERQARAIRLALCVGAALTFGMNDASTRAEDFRFNLSSTEISGLDVTSSAPTAVVTSNAPEQFGKLDAALDDAASKSIELPKEAMVELSSDLFANEESNADEADPVLVAQRPGDGSESVQTFTPISTFGSTRKLNPKTASAATVRARSSENAYERATTSGAVRASFSSSAYGIPQSDAVAQAARSLLDVNDVREFSESGQGIGEGFDDAYLDEINENVAGDEKLDSITFEEIADECFYALDPYSSLFIEYEPTAEWTESVLEYVETILGSLEAPNAETRAAISRFSSKIEEADLLKESLIAADRSGRGAKTSDGQTPKLVERYNLSQRLALLETFKTTLERRTFFWTASLDYFAAKNANLLAAPKELSTRQLLDLMRLTSEVRAFFGDSPNGQSWRASFDVDQLSDDLNRTLELQTAVVDMTSSQGIDTVIFDSNSSNRSESSERALDDAELESLGVPLSRRDLLVKEKNRRMKFLRDRLNSVAYKIAKTPMTPEQRQIFKRKPLMDWSSLVSSLACDQADGRALLYEFERYENTSGGDSGRALQQLALRMTNSRSESCRSFGRAVDAIYDNPNVKAYVSEALINRLLPIRDPEFGVVQETILNNPVAGSRRVDTTVSIDLVPDSERLLMNLTVNGRVSTQTSSEVFSAKLHNQSYANYVGKKTLEWRDNGVVYSPASVSASTANQLSGVETDVDFVPLVGGIAREVVRSQYELKQNEIRAQMQVKVSQEARARIDKEADERFDALNAQLRNNFFARLNNLGLSLKTQRSKTTNDWLLASLRLGSDYSLGCQSTEPATLDGAFADVKIHESAINSYLAQLELGGMESTPRQTLEYLADKLDRPALRDVELEENDLSFTFAKTDPIVVRFFEDQAQLRLKFAKMRLGAQNWEDLEIVVCFRPSVTPNGQPTVTRDGVVEIYGPANIRSLLPLRAMVSKVFPAQKSFEIKPEILQTDERFVGLGLGLCRVSRGWFAISVVKNESSGL